MADFTSVFKYETRKDTIDLTPVEAVKCITNYETKVYFTEYADIILRLSQIHQKYWWESFIKVLYLTYFKDETSKKYVFIKIPLRAKDDIIDVPSCDLNIPHAHFVQPGVIVITKTDSIEDKIDYILLKFKETYGEIVGLEVIADEYMKVQFQKEGDLLLFSLEIHMDDECHNEFMIKKMLLNGNKDIQMYINCMLKTIGICLDDKEQITYYKHTCDGLMIRTNTHIFTEDKLTHIKMRTRKYKYAYKLCLGRPIRIPNTYGYLKIYTEI